MNDSGQPVLYAIVTGAPPARHIHKLVDLAHADGWDVCVIASPDGTRFIDADALAVKTGHTVRSTYKQPGTVDVLPPADAFIAAPITCNSLAKWAAGISDSLHLGLLVEAVGRRKPVVARPFSNAAQISFPAIQDAMHKLATWGVIMLTGDDAHTPHEPGTGGRYVDIFPWPHAWRAALNHPWANVPKGQG